MGIHSVVIVDERNILEFCIHCFSLERLGLGMDIRRLKVCLSVLFLKSLERQPC